MSAHGPAAPRPGEICKAPNAPFGYAPRGGRKALKPGQRPLRSCADPACRAEAKARKARADSGGLAPRDPAAHAPAPTSAPAPVPQADLFSGR